MNNYKIDPDMVTPAARAAIMEPGKEYMLYPHYKPRPLRHPVDIKALLRIVGATVVPLKNGFICTEARLSGGNSLWTFMVRLLGETCLGRSRADESGTWRSMTRALSQLAEKEPEALKELVGDIRWERECRSSYYPVRIPRGANPEMPPAMARGTFVVGVTIRSPEDPGCKEDLRKAVLEIAPDFPARSKFEVIWREYLNLWQSHEAVELQRVICVHNRLGGGEKRRKLWRNSQGDKNEEQPVAEPLIALATAATSVTIAPGILAGLYHPFNARHGGTGVDAVSFLRLISAATETHKDGYLATDANQVGGKSLWTFIVRLLGPPCLGAKPLTESNTWFALAKAVSKLKKTDPALLRDVLGGKEWARECTVRAHPIRVPRPANERELDTYTVRRVQGTFLTGIRLRQPTPQMEAGLATAIAQVAPLFPPDRYPEVFAEYHKLWHSHECRPIREIAQDGGAGSTRKSTPRAASSSSSAASSSASASPNGAAASSPNGGRGRSPVGGGDGSSPRPGGGYPLLPPLPPPPMPLLGKPPGSREHHHLVDPQTAAAVAAFNAHHHSAAAAAAGGGMPLPVPPPPPPRDAEGRMLVDLPPPPLPLGSLANALGMPIEPLMLPPEGEGAPPGIGPVAAGGQGAGAVGAPGGYVEGAEAREPTITTAEGSNLYSV